MMGRPELTLHC
jgi:hypothetical protein